jgi:gliding motility-associated-like protein
MTLIIPKYFCAFLFLALPMTKSLQAQTGTSLPPFVITAQVLQNANCNQQGILLAEAKDGLAPYQYQIVQAIPPGSSPIPPPPPTPIGSWSTSNTFSISEGTYVLFAKDSMGVVVSTIKTVTKDSAPKTYLTLANQCVPEGNFELQLAATQPGIPPYFLSTNGSIFQSVSLPYTLSNQNSGEYTLNLKDSNGCESAQTITIFSPLAFSAASISQPSCTSNDGIVVVATTGGSANFEYQIIGQLPTTNPVFTSLSSGSYRFRVDDKTTGCFEEIEVNLESATPIAGLKLTSTDVSCNGGNDGSITVQIDPSKSSTNDGSTYKYSIHKIHFQEAPLFSGLKAGSYTVDVISERGCTATNTITILEPEPLVANLTIKTPLNCNVPPLLELVVNGGNPSYTFSSDGAFFNKTLLNSPAEIEAGIGSYTIYVKDSKGCRSISNEIRIDSIPGLQVEVDESLATIKCNGESTATITAMASGGLGIYRYSLVDELSNSIRPFQTSGVFTNLGAGNYSIKAESNNCSPAFSKQISIKDVAPLELSLKSGGINEIIAFPTGGVGNYKFTFEGEYYDDIPSYIYYNTQDFLVTVQDANGCTASVSQKFNYIDICTPNYFTPNEDGINDTWAPGCSTNYTNLVFSIYDRYGQELGTYRYGQSWDGNHQGAPLPSGDYWYLLKLNNSKDDREFIGHFTLYR